MSDAEQVKEDWYLDPAEWDKLREERFRARELYDKAKSLSRAGNAWSLKKLLAHLQAMEAEYAALQNVMNDASIASNERNKRMRHHVNVWLNEARHFAPQLMKQVMNSPYAELYEMRREAAEVLRISKRLEIREKLLLDAIAAGVYMSKRDLREIGVQPMKEAQFFQLLKNTVKQANGEPVRRHRAKVT